jgi:hypothetical protein
MPTMFLPMFGAITPQDLDFGDHLDFMSGKVQTARDRNADAKRSGFPRLKVMGPV